MALPTPVQYMGACSPRMFRADMELAGVRFSIYRTSPSWGMPK